MVAWMPDLPGRDSPRYLAIADAIADDIAAGRLAPGDRLPPQRDLARRLSTSISPPSRAAMSRRRNAGSSNPWSGGALSCGAAQWRAAHPARAARVADLSMNMPPEPEDPELIARMREGFEASAADLVSLLRYQGFGGSPADKRRGVDLAGTARAGARAGPHLRLARAPSARCSASSACSRRPAIACSARPSPIPACALDRRAAWAAARRREADRDGASPTRWQEPARACAEGDLLQPDAAESDDPSRSPSGGGRRSAASRAGTTSRSSRTTPTASFRPTGPRRWRPSPQTSAGTSPGSPNASARGCASPMSWCRTPARAGPFNSRDARLFRHGLARRRGARDPLDRGRHRRHDPALHPGETMARAAHRGGRCRTGLLSRRSR